jgi:anti-sigma factor RsiW
VEAEATLNTNERVTVDAHLSACPSCHEEVATIRAMGSFLKTRGAAALPACAPSPDLWDRIEERIVAEQPARRRSSALRPVLLFAPALAAIVVAVVVMRDQPQSSTIRLLRARWRPQVNRKRRRNQRRRR